MAFVVVCPRCETRLKSANPVPAGKKLNCPKCKTPFVTEEAGKASTGLSNPGNPAVDVEGDVSDGNPFDFHLEAPKPAVKPASKSVEKPKATPAKAAEPENEFAFGEQAAELPTPRPSVAPPASPKSRPGAGTPNKKPKPIVAEPVDDFAFLESQPVEEPPTKSVAKAPPVSPVAQSLPQVISEPLEDDEFAFDDAPAKKALKEEIVESELVEPADEFEFKEKIDRKPKPKPVPPPEPVATTPEDEFVFRETLDPTKAPKQVDDDEDEFANEDELLFSSKSKKSKKKGGEEEGKTQAYSRSRQKEVDDPDDDSPLARKRRQARKNKKLLLIVMPIAFLILGGLTTTLLYFLGVFKSGDSGGSTDVLAWMVGDSQVVMSMDVDAIAKSGNALKDSDSLTLKPEEIDRMTQSFTTRGGTFESCFYQFKTAKKASILESIKPEALTHNGRKYYKTSRDYLFFPSDSTMVQTRSDTVMKKLLEKESGKVDLSGDLQALCKKGSGQVWIAMTGPAAADFSKGFTQTVRTSPVAKAKKEAVVANDPRPKSVLVKSSPAGGETSMEMEMTFDTEAVAKNVFDMYDAISKGAKGLGSETPTPPRAKGGKTAQIQTVFESLRASRSGKTVTISMKIPGDGSSGPFGL